MIRSIFQIITIPDKILIALLLILSISSVFYLRGSINNAQLEIYVDNELIGSYNLQQDQIIPIKDGITAEISDGRVRMLESVCKNQICVKQGHSKTIPVICAPERIALIIKHKKKPDIMITR
ncbi:MAG: NusG domain II-containing protein [Candidatus Cloacimonetes bacterium]|nr:NusG domain II-containing protein [Candidatus Cloacimonadota bacterium]